MLYVVVLPNNYFRPGTFLESDDNQMVQKVRTWTENGRLRTGGYEGIMIPLDKIRPFTQAVLKRGFDDQGVHAELRGAYKHRDLRSESRRLEDQLWEEFGESFSQNPSMEAKS